MKKPSKKIITLIVVAFLIIALSAYGKFHGKSVTTANNNTEAEDQYSDIGYMSDEDKNISVLDSDGDGLPDWQEILTNTDPRNTDTDNDGTQDGKELELGRDPAVPGPDDKLENIKSGTDNSGGGDTTISEQVSKNLFANAVYLSNNDGITADNVDTLVNNLVDGVQSNFTFKEYLASNLPMVTNPTAGDLRFFASTFATLQIQLLGDLANNPDPQAMANVYNKHAANLYSLQIPSEISDTMLEIINNFSKVGAVFDAFSKQKEDPLKLPLAVKAYQEAANDQADLVRIIGRYLDKNDIINSLDENARDYWTLSITE